MSLRTISLKCVNVLCAAEWKGFIPWKHKRQHNSPVWQKSSEDGRCIQHCWCSQYQVLMNSVQRVQHSAGNRNHQKHGNQRCGIIVHDCWGIYWKYQDVTHAICCVHLPRELNGVIENHPAQTWIVRFKKLLLGMKNCVIKTFFQIRVRSAAITTINLIWSMILSSKLHMKKIHILKLLLKSAVVRKRAKY